MKKNEDSLKYKNFMVTILSNKDGSLKLPDKDSLISVLNEESSKWVFQEETHENSEVENTHYQCCVSLNIRKRKSTLLKNLSEGLNHPIERIRVDKMAGTWDQAYAYCSKSDTRVGETVYSNFMKEQYDYQDIAFLGNPEKRFPWQNTLLEELFDSIPHSLKAADDRTIIWITDQQGCTGKSKLVKYMCSHNDNTAKLGFGTANQLRSAVVTVGPKKLYIIDIPRTLGEDDSINDILSVIEDIKNGFVVSSFYGTYTKLIFTPPHIVIFSNSRCPVNKLSGDRWKCYTILEKELRYSIDNFDYIDKGYSMTHEGVLQCTLN